MLMWCSIHTRSSYMTGCELAIAQSVCLKVGHMVTSQVLASLLALTSTSFSKKNE